MKFTLILFLYAGAFSKGDSVALTSVYGFNSEQACIAAGNKAVSMTGGTIKDGKFVCVAEGAVSVPK